MGLPFAYEACNPYDPGPLVPHLKGCPYCAETYLSQNELEFHIQDVHPRLQAVPVLLLAGQPQAVRIPVIIQQQSQLESLYILNAGRMEVIGGQKGRPFITDHVFTLKAHLQECTRRKHHLQVLVWPVDGSGSMKPEEFHLEICIPDPSEISALDGAFKTLQNEGASIEKMVEGIQNWLQVNQENPAAGYGQGIWHFLRAVVMKKLGSPQSKDIIKQAMTKALQGVSRVDSPLARAVTGYLRFNLNHFSQDYGPCGVARLDSIMKVFQSQGPTSGSSPGQVVGKAVSRTDWTIPSDPETDLLIHIAYCRLEEALQVTNPMLLDEDEDKRSALLAHQSIQAGFPALARPHLEKLGPLHPWFGEWVGGHLKGTP